MYAAFLLMTALYHRDLRNGSGQYIDLALYEPLFTLLGPQVVDYDQLGIVQERNGSRLPFAAPRNIYKTKDGEFVSIAGSGQSIFERIMRALDLEALMDDPRFKGNRDRIQHIEALDEAIQGAVSKLTQEEVLARLDEFQAAVAPVYNIAQIFEDPHYQARETITSVPDRERGTIRMQNVVGKFSATPGKIRHAGPALGEHNQEILMERLGYAEAELREAGMLP